jgi:hypothetical protein
MFQITKLYVKKKDIHCPCSFKLHLFDCDNQGKHLKFSSSDNTKDYYLQRSNDASRAGNHEGSKLTNSICTCWRHATSAVKVADVHFQIPAARAETLQGGALHAYISRLNAKNKQQQ